MASSSAPPSSRTLARRGALHALAAVERGAILGAALDDLNLPAAARPFARELAGGVLRHRARLDYTLAPLLRKALSKLDAPVRAALRLAAYERAWLDTPAPAVANEYAGLMRGERLTSAVAFVNAIARRLPAQPRAAPDAARDAVEHLAVEHSHPAWLVRRWFERWGFEECVALCAANNTIAPLALRVNTLRATREKIIENLRARGLDAVPGLLSPDAIIVPDAGNPLDWPEWQSGQIFAQDEAAQLVARLAAPQDAQVVVDAAAAPGGKTTHLAGLMNDEGRILACDLAPGRAKLVRENAARLGLGSIETQVGDFRDLATTLPPADLVLLDAPCLGTGTLRRRPDAKWRKTPQQLAELVELQAALLDAAARVVKPGGALVYATCSLEDEENQVQARAFMARHAAWHIEAPPAAMANLAGALPIVTPEGFLHTLPHRHHCDGMFAVKFRRGEKQE